MVDQKKREAFEKVWAARDSRWTTYRAAALKESRTDDGYASEHDQIAWWMWNLTGNALEAANARIAELESQLAEALGGKP